MKSLEASRSKESWKERRRQREKEDREDSRKRKEEKSSIIVRQLRHLKRKCVIP